MRRTTRAELVDVLRRLNLPRQQVFMVHSSLLRFGLFEDGLPGVMDCLHQVLGDRATLVMPTFTFSYGSTRHWDARQSKAETGALCEHFRKLPGVGRTVQPFHSMAVAGPQADALLACCQTSSFGPGSPWALLSDMGAINIGLGTEYIGGATFLHHAEEMAQVPYREYKDFPGRVLGHDGHEVALTYRMYVRKTFAEGEVRNDWSPVWDGLQRHGLVQCERLHGAPVFAMPVQPILRWLQGCLATDPYYCAQRVTTDQEVESHEQA